MPDHIPQFDPFSTSFRLDPYPIYEVYRTRDPIHWGLPATPGVAGTWYLTRYDDVTAVLRDPRFGRESRRFRPPGPPPPDALKPLVEMTSQQMLFRDPPDHTRLRALVSKAFTPAAAEGLRPRLIEIANALVERRIDSGTMDIVADYALQFSVSVIAELLGAPAEYHWQFRQWSNAFAAAIDVRRSLAVAEQAGVAIVEMSSFMGRLIDDKRRDPKDDLVSALIAVQEQGDRLNEQELVAMCCLLLIGGNETGVNLVGNGTLALLRNRAQLDLLRDNPALLPSAIEELLRFESPVQMTFRYAMEDVEMRDRQIRRGDSVGVVLAAANRDPERFRNPDQLDISRTDNRHATFGGGIHACLGAPLARLEGQIAFETLLRRLPDIELPKTADVEWRELIAFRGLRSLSVSFSTPRQHSTPADPSH